MSPRFATHAFAAALWGCGVSVIATDAPQTGVSGEGGSPSATGDASSSNQTVDGDGSTPTNDAGIPIDATLDSATPLDPSKVTLSYGAGKDKKIYRFDSVAKAFTPLPSVGCPAAEETAVMTDGSVYITSSNNADLFRLTATGCTPVRTGSSFPYALGTAPMGTFSATEETMVGYVSADYVRVDRNSGDVTLITAGALGGLRPAGDLTALGKKGYLAALTNTGAGAFACPNGGDCIVEVNLKTGAPITLLKQFPGLGIYGLAHSGGNLLFYANGQVLPFNPTTMMLGASLAPAPTGANFSGAGAAPYPPL